jgi:uncharacterized membrane protein (DUF485 family)
MNLRTTSLERTRTGHAMFKYWVILILLFVIGLYCLYGADYFSWVMATPVSPERLHRAQRLGRICFGGFVLAFVLFIVTVVRMAHLQKRGER